MSAQSVNLSRLVVVTLLALGIWLVQQQLTASFASPATPRKENTAGFCSLHTIRFTKPPRGESEAFACIYKRGCRECEKDIKRTED